MKAFFGNSILILIHSIETSTALIPSIKKFVCSKNDGLSGTPCSITFSVFTVILMIKAVATAVIQFFLFFSWEDSMLQ